MMSYLIRSPKTPTSCKTQNLSIKKIFLIAKHIFANFQEQLTDRLNQWEKPRTLLDFDLGALTWKMYDVTIPITVKSIKTNKKILIELGNYQDLTSVEWTFTELNTDATFVSIVNTIISADTEKAIAMVRNSTEGFTLVLAGLKALLEHNVILNLVGDRFPKGLNP